ncbi:flagellar hook-basal body complex protein FliE [Alphaproteobacteria bacterium]|nr:flagellar hook-basal body complex protein FliE [Alphaproteobacteria bacterium]
MTSIGPVGHNISSLHAQVLKRAETALSNESDTGFSDRIGDALKSVADTQTKSAELTKAYELGTETDLTKVMVNQQVSSLGFQMTLNVRNKVLSAYKDIMNMPV